MKTSTSNSYVLLIKIGDGVNSGKKYDYYIYELIFTLWPKIDMNMLGNFSWKKTILVQVKKELKRSPQALKTDTRLWYSML